MYMILLLFHILRFEFGKAEFHGPAVTLKDTTSTVVYDGISLSSEFSLTLEFFGNPVQGRLLYAENATMGTFISLKINRIGVMRLELKLLTTDQSHQFVILSAPLETSAEQWHSADLRISLKKKLVVLFVDGRNAYPGQLNDIDTSNAEFAFGNYLYLGCLPPSLKADASKVVHFTAAMEAAFKGTIKNILLNGEGLRILHLLSGAEIATGLSFCHRLSQVQQSWSICSADRGCMDGCEGPICSCTPTGQKNGLCRYQPERQKLVLDGKGWIQFVPAAALDRFSRVSLHFNTKTSDAFIFLADFADAENSSILVQLKNGSIEFRLISPMPSKDAGVKRLHACKSPYDTCADGTWHHLSLTLSHFHVLQTEVDGESLSLEFPKSQLRFKSIYIGSSEPIKSKRYLNLLSIPNFTGSFKRILYQIQSDIVDLMDHASTNSSSKQMNEQIGEVQTTNVAFESLCEVQKTRRDTTTVTDASPVTFKQPGGYIRSSKGWRTVSVGKISFKLRTFKKSCLLLFSSSGWPKHGNKFAFPIDGPVVPVSPIERITGNDIFSAELREGYLVFLLNTGSGVNELPTANIWRSDHQNNPWFVADGKEHQVEISLLNGSLTVNVDGRSLHLRPMKKPKYTVLNLNGYMYVGGLPEELRDDAPPQVWSARLRADFIGQLGALVIDGESIDLDLEARARWARNHISSSQTDPEETCAKDETACTPGECSKESWGTPLCDCTKTNFVGKYCKEAARVLEFDGFQGVGVSLSRLPQQSEAESLLLRLQTKQKNALLFESFSASSTAPDRFGVEIFNGTLIVFYNLGMKNKRFSVVEINESGKWYTVQILRRSKQLRVTVDNSVYNYDIDDDANLLDSDYNCIGSIVENYSVQKSDIPVDSFVGRLSQFHLNGVDMLKLLGDFSSYRSKDTHEDAYDSATQSLIEKWKDNIEVTASSSNNERIHAFPLHFQGSNGFLEFSLRKTRCLVLRFSLKTSTSVGIIFFATNAKDDFVAVEIFDGQLHIRYSYDAIRGLSAFQKTSLNDSKWHDLQFGVCTYGNFSIAMQVDGRTSIPTGLPAGQIVTLEHILEQLYLGGLPIEKKREFSKYLQASNGFDGCLSDIGVSYGSTADLGLLDNLQEENPLQKSKLVGDVKLGCLLPRQKKSDSSAWEIARTAQNQCLRSVCGFGGRCVQQLNTYYCDCRMSGFSGPACTDVALAIKYSSHKAGCAVFEFSPPRNTSRDAIAFGIQTSQKSPAVLIHLTGHSKSTDFLRLELVSSKKIFVLRLTYNMGSGMQTLLESKVDLTDGLFHVVRVIRQSARMQLQVDSEAPLEAISGQNGSHFNDAYQVYVGCDPLRMPAGVASYLGPAFVGHISGININGVYLADLLHGETLGSVFYKAGRDILLDPTFTPKVRRISNLPANDMGAEQAHSSASRPTAPLVVAKPNCMNGDSSFRNQLASCKPAVPNGIVVPKWNLPVTREKPASAGQSNAWSAHPNMNQHHQSQSAEVSIIGGSGRSADPASEVLLPAWNHDRVPQDDAVRFNGADYASSLEEISEDDIGSRLGQSGYFPSLYTWILIGSGAIAVFVIALIIGYAVYKFRRRNEGSYNVEENRTYINQRSAPPAAQSPHLSPSLELAAELVPLQKSTLNDAQSPSKEWYV